MFKTDGATQSKGDVDCTRKYNKLVGKAKGAFPFFVSYSYCQLVRMYLNTCYYTHEQRFEQRS